VFIVLAACGGGGPRGALSLGVVSGTTPTTVSVTFTNPYDQARS